MFRVNQSNSEAQSAIRDFQRFFRDSSTPEKTCTTISIGKWNSVTRITHLEGTEGKISPKSYRIRFKEIPMATIHGQNDPVVLPCCFSMDKDQTYPHFWW